MRLSKETGEGVDKCCSPGVSDHKIKLTTNENQSPDWKKPKY